METKGQIYILHGSRSDEFTIYNLSDLHYGNKACAVNDLRRDIERIRLDDHAFWLGGGDYAEYIGLTDRRFDPDAVADNLKVSDMGKLGWILTAEVRDLLKPIAHKCLGLLLGNHEKHYQRDKEQSHLHAWLCAELGVQNLEYSALFDLNFIRCKVGKPILSARSKAPHATAHTQGFRFFVHHGAGFASTPAGKLKRLIDFMNSFDAEIFMLGHVHDREGRRQVRVGANADCSRLTQKETVGVISGSYLKTYGQGVTTYGEQRGYAPVVLGPSFVRIRPETRKITAEI